MTATTRPATRRPSRPKPKAATRPAEPASAADPLEPFSAPVRAWFESAFEAPTPAQIGGWASISTGRHTLIHAPTGSGKTLAAFLWCLDRLVRDPSPPPSRTAPGTVRVLYVSPLKALTYDVERNLRAPLHGIALAAHRLGEPEPRISIAGRTGDTPQEQRRELARRPPDILVTTPESLYLLLTSAAREILRGVETIIVDEVHAIAGTKRGAHLALSLERLEAPAPGRRADAPADRPVGHAATARDDRPVPRRDRAGPGGRDRRCREPQAARAPGDVPVEDMSRLGEVSRPTSSPAGPRRPATCGRASGRRSIRACWSSSGPTAARSSSRTAGGWQSGSPQRLNEAAGEELVRAHHGSIAREQRLKIEEDLKAGRMPALVATSSLELGIDMGAVDLVVQVEAPTRVARGLQRVGRAGHQVGAPSRRHLPEVPRRPPRVRGRVAADARGRDRDDDACRATRSTCSPSSSSRWPSWTAGRSASSALFTPRRAVRDADARGARRRARDARRRVSRRTSSPSSSRASPGTG